MRSQSPTPAVNINALASSTPPSARRSNVVPSASRNGLASVPVPPEITQPSLVALPTTSEAPTLQQLPCPIPTPSVAYSQPVVEVQGGLLKPSLSSPNLGPPPALQALPDAPVVIPGLQETSPFRSQYDW